MDIGPVEAIIIAVFVYLLLRPLIIWIINKAKQIILFLKTVNWTLVISITIVLVTASIITYKQLKKRKQIKEEKEFIKRIEQQKRKETIEKLDNILSDKFVNGGYYDLEKTIKEKAEKTKEYIETIPKGIKQKYQNKIIEYYERANTVLKQLERIKQKIEQQKQAEEEKERQREEELERRAEELYEYKKSKNSIEALPLKHNYTEKEIEQATWLMKRHVHDIMHEKFIREIAIEYYKENPIDTKPELETEEEETIYEQVREEINEGKIRPRKKDNQETEYIKGITLEKNIYKAKGLDETTKSRAIKQKFRHIRGVDLDGKVIPGGIYIKKENEREGDYHFYTKHLFAKLDTRMILEYCKEDKRADIALITEYFKLAIEIETGANREEQITEKTEWLNKNFDAWIFVCKRKLVSKYSKYVDGKKSLCLTPKKAKEHIMEIIATIDHQ